MTEKKYPVLGKELKPYANPRGTWSESEYRANYGVLTLSLIENVKSGEPWHYWEAAIFIGQTELRRTQYISAAGKYASELMPQTPDKPLCWLRDNAIEIAREMQDLANWEPG